MSREKAEKLGTLFLAVFSTGLVAQFATTSGLEPQQWFGATAAVLGSLTVAVMVRIWRQPQPQRITVRDDDRRER
jgi:DMSO reductase anchor subunit